MVRKEKKQEKKNSSPASGKKQAKPVGRKAATRASQKIENELVQVDEKLHKMFDLLGNLPLGICFFNKEDEIKYCNERFAIITGFSEETLLGKKLRKNQLWGGSSQKDEFKELFKQARESGERFTVERMNVSSSKMGVRAWNLTFIPQKDSCGQYDGMELVIEDVTDKNPAHDDSLCNTLYDITIVHTEMQPLLDNMVAVLRDYSGCSSIKLIWIDRLHDRIYKAVSDIRAGLWNKDTVLSEAEVNGLFNDVESLSGECLSHGGSIYIRDVNQIESRLTGVLRDIVINSSNSFGFCSMAFIPIRYEGAIEGFIQVADNRGEIRPDVLTMIENSTNHLRLMLERAGLKEEMRIQREGLIRQMNERNAHLETLNEHLKQEVAERKKAQEEMRIQRDLAMALNRVDNISDVLDICLDTAIKAGGMDCGSIYVVDEGRGALKLAAAKGVMAECREKVINLSNDSAIMQKIPKGDSFYLTAGEIEGELCGSINEEGIKVVGYIPVYCEKELLAVLSIGSHEKEDITYTERNAVEAVAGELGITLKSIRNRHAFTESEARYKTLFEKTQNPVLVVDEDGNYIDGNDAALAFLECSREELLNMNVRDTLPPYLDDEWYDKYRKFWQSGNTVERDYYVWGKIKVLEITITPLKIGERQVYIGIGTDLTERKRIERELKQSEERYRSHFESVKDVIYSIDKDLKITDISPSIERLVGYNPEEIIGKSVQDLLFIDRPALEKMIIDINCLLNGDTIQGNEYQFRGRNGDVIYVEVSGSPLYRDGKLTGAISTVRDITERKKTEEAARKSEDKYRKILEEMDESYYEIDTEGNFIDVNEAMARRFGYAREELIGRNFRDVTHEEDYDRKLAAFSRALQTGRPRFWEPFTGVKKDGKVIYLEDSIYPLRNERDEIIGLQGIARDVTERRLWEAALKESEEKFRRLFFQSPVGVAMVSLEDRRFIAVNDSLCKLLGYTSEELTAKCVPDVTHPDYQEFDIMRAGELIRGEIDQYSIDKQYIRKDGSIVWGHVSMRLIKDTDGKPLYMLPVIEDITDRKRIEESLNRSEAMFKNIIEHSNEMFYIHDLDYKFVYISPQVKAITGYSVDEASQAFLKSITDNPINRTGRAATLKALSTGEKQPTYIMEVLRKDGVPVLLEFNETPLKDEKGKITGMVGVGRDVTAQYKAEEEIRASEARYRLLAFYNQQLNEIFISFTEAAHLKDLMIRIGEALKSLTGATGVGVTSYKAESGTLRAEVVLSSEQLISKGEALIGRKLVGMELKVPEEIKAVMLGAIIGRLRGFDELFFGAISPQQSAEIMKAGGWDRLLGLSFNYGYELAGTAIALLPPDSPEIPDDVLKTFAYIAGLAIFKKRDEEQLKDSKERFKGIVEHIDEVFFIQDRHNKFIYLSPQSKEVFGYSIDEINDSWEELGRIVESNQEAMKNIKAAIKTGKKQPPYIYEITRKDGVRISIEINETPLLDADGKFNGFIGVARDVTGRRAMEKALIESEARFRNIVEASPDPIWEVDVSGKFTYVSPRIREIMGFEPAELMGKPFISLIRSDRAEEVWQKFIEAKQEGGRVYRTEVEALAADGREIILEIRATGVLDSDGKLAGFRGISRDITENIRFSNALRESEEKYRSVVEGANEGIFVLQDGKFKFANDRLIKFSSYTRDELRQLIADDPLKFIVHPDDLEKVRRYYQKRINGEQVPNQYEIKWLDKSGATKWAAINVTAFKWVGRPATLGFVTDITEKKQIESALASSEEKYRTVLEDMSEFYYELDPRGNYTFINKAAEKIFGYSVEELTGMNYKVYTPADQVRQRVEVFTDVFQTGRPRYSEYLEHIRKDGSKVFVETSILPIRNEKGEIVGLRGLGKDITEKIRAEEELRKHSLLLDSAYDSIIAYDTKGNIFYANESACTSRGYTRDEMLQMNVRQLVPPDAVAKLEERLNLVDRQQELIFEAVHLHKSGIQFPVEAYTRLINLAGEEIIISVYRDITSRRQSERALKESEERYRLLAENSMDVIVTTDMNLKVTYISPSARFLFGQKAEDIMRMLEEKTLTAEKLGLATEDAQRIISGMRSLIEDPLRTQVQEMELRHPDGFNNWIEVKMSIMREKGGQAVGILAVVRDITQQKKMTERLIRADRLASLGEMAAGLAHEVNNPLTAVMGFAYLVMQNPSLPPEVKKDIDSIYNEGKRAADVIKNFLLFARGRKPEKQAVFINDIIENTLRLRHSQMTKENITVLLNLAEDLPAIHGDTSQLQQVILNIILNAEHFMYQNNKKGTLSISTLQDSNRIKLVIKDDGPGIPPDKIDRIFDPFYTTKQVGEGTGLGLSICHGIISEHGGNIYAESRAGEGATFVIELPAGE